MSNIQVDGHLVSVKKKDRIKELEAQVATLLALCQAQAEEISYLRSRVSELEARLSQNSTNSSKAPSSDLYKVKQTQSLRPQGAKKPGSQPGHKGDTLRMVEDPDAFELLSPGPCAGCGHDLSGVVASGYERRQVFELPEMRLRVTEYRSEAKRCPCCGCWTKGGFPAGVSQPAQYGPGVKALGTYLTGYQLLPYGRIAELFEDLFSHRVSTSFLSGNNHACATRLEPFIAGLKQALSVQPVLHGDETGFYVGGQRWWLHSLSTERHSYYLAHPKRGAEGMHAMGVLPDYGGTLIHDFWKAYYRFRCLHGICCAHLLRELKYGWEAMGSEWAAWTSEFLNGLHGRVAELKASGDAAMGQAELAGWLSDYDELMDVGMVLHPPPQPQANEVGKAGKGKIQNLLARFVDYREDILRFATDFQVPFTNNNAEQAVRMMKVKQKISGCFRTQEGANDFATIRSYIATMKKQGRNIMDAISAAFENQPFQAQA